MRILLTEDHPGARELWSELLASLGHEVTSVTGAEAAWELFQAEPFPLVLVDLAGRRTNGLSLIRQIRSVPQGDRTVVLVAADRGETELLRSAIAAGADDYVRKPVDAALLDVRLALAMNRSDERVQRQRVEEELRKRLDQVRAVYNLADAASHTRPLEDVFAEAIEGLERALHTRRAAILLFDESGSMRFQVWQGISERYRLTVEGQSPWWRGLRDPSPIVIDDAESHPAVAEHRAAMLLEGIRSLMFVPIVYRGELLGKFVVYYGAPHETTDEELLLAQTIANHVASAVARTRADEALRTSEERFRQLAENIDAAFWISEIDRPSVLYVSPSYERIWGRPGTELQASPLGALATIHREDRPRVLAMQAKVAGGEVSEGEYRIHRPDGTVRWIRGRAFPVRDERGIVYRMAGIAEDVTRYKQLEEQLLQSERLSAAGILVGGIAHQLNNPLTGVLGFSQLLLRNSAVEGKVRQSAERIHEEALRAKQIVASLLRFARHRTPKLEPVDLNAVIRGTLDSMGEELGRHAIAVSAQLNSELPSIQADRLQLRQLFTSLFTHAVRAMQNGHGREPKSLQVSTGRNERGRVEIRVADNGPGVPPELRRQLFDPLLGADDDRESPLAALSMAFAIVQDHRGEILVTESEPPPGATFVIELPLSTGSDPAPAALA